MTKGKFEKEMQENGWICVHHECDEEWMCGQIHLILFPNGDNLILKQENGEWAFLNNLIEVSFTKRRILFKWNYDYEWYLVY